MRARRLAGRFTVAAVALLGACDPGVSYLHVEVDFTADKAPVDRLRVQLLHQDQAVLAAPVLLPPDPGTPVTSGEKFTILVADGRAGQALDVRVSALRQGLPIAWGERLATVVLHHGVDVTVPLDTTPTLVGLGIDEHGPVAIGQTVQLVARGSYDDGSTADLGAQTIWASADPTTATVGDGTSDPRGLVRGVKRGATTVSAVALGRTANTTVSVTAALKSIAVTPMTAMVDTGGTATLKATGTYEDGSTLDLTTSATWTSHDPRIATVTVGMVAGVKAGQVEIDAGYGGLSGMATVTVTDAQLQSLEMVTPMDPLQLKTTGSQPLAVKGHYSDGTTEDLTAEALWESSDATVASVGNAAGSKGVVHATAPGSAVITARFLGYQAQVTVKVSLL
jgi:hypothetical protein